MAEQAGRISANTRYLEPRLVDYAERLVATFPNEIDRVVFTCTGSESNDLALRIARFASGNEGVIVSSYAYTAQVLRSPRCRRTWATQSSLARSCVWYRYPDRRAGRKPRPQTFSRRRSVQPFWI
jgi:4-aminobutyrate aminotransferase-like enzyme